MVAILDTGVDKSHSFLSGKVVSEACYSTNSVFWSSTTVCPNGLEEQTGSGAGVNCPISRCNHGTHVAGIAAGNGPSFSGVAKDAQIMSIQVFSRIDSDAVCFPSSAPCVLTFTSDVISGLERVHELRDTFSIASANLSLGGGKFTSACDTNISMKAIIDNLRSVGIATVIASGNNGYTDAISFPACISSAVSVGATTKVDQVVAFSNSASFLDLLAPGVSITSSVPGDAFVSSNGTSMSTPHVAGAWTILKQQSPELSVDGALTAFKNTGQAILDTRNNITKPRIQVNAALDDLSGPSCTPPASGDWIVTADCTLRQNSTAPANVIVQPNVALTIASGISLDINFSSHHLRVKNGAKVVIKTGGKTQ